MVCDAMNNEKTGIVFLVGGGPGDPGLVTVRGVECLQQADVVVFDRLVCRNLLAYAPQAQRIDVGKCPQHHPVPQEEINNLLVSLAREGKVVVRLKGGDPFVFGRGGEEAQALSEAGIPFEVVPGVTSAIAAPAYAGIPVTHRDMACSVAFITGHRASCRADSDDDWRLAARGAQTLVFLMGVHNLPRIVEQLRLGGLPEDTPIALVQQGTTGMQKSVMAKLEDVLVKAAGIRPPAVIVVGEVVGLQPSLNWFEQAQSRPLLGLRILNTRPRKSVRNATSSGDGRGFLDVSYKVLPGIDDFSRRLCSLGADVLEMPVTKILPVEDYSELDRCILKLATHKEAYDWLVFTSANSVELFLDRLLIQGHDLRDLAKVRIAAVGEATGASLRNRGLRPDFLPSRSTGAVMGVELPLEKGMCVLLPSSTEADDEASDLLVGRDATVDVPPVYRLAPGDPDPDLLDMLFRGDVDAVTFFSPSAVRGLAAMLEPRSLQEALSSVAVVCIGPTTAKAAEEAGLQVHRVAEEATAESMCQALVEMQLPRYSTESTGVAG